MSNLDLTGQPTFASHFGGVLIDTERQVDEVGGIKCMGSRARLPEFDSKL